MLRTAVESAQPANTEVAALTDMEVALLEAQVVVRHGLLGTVAVQEQQGRVMLAVKTQPLEAPKVAVVVVAQAQ
jgi:hypothetical protein